MGIDILMASYDSAKYIKEQINSILTQESQDWRLIIRDDASHDKTPEIIKEYESKHPDKITAVTSGNNIGAKANFNELMKLSTAPYIMFADHDDIWLKDKVSLTLEKMRQLETAYGKDTPLLVFTDKSLTDCELTVTAESSSKAEKFATDDICLNRLLVQNIASGCTMMINRNLAELCGDIPNNALVHDYWMMLLAVTFGKIGYVDKPTMLYRQHSANEIGAKKYGFEYILNKLKKGNRKNIQHNVRQAQAIFDKYEKTLPEKEAALIREFIKLPDASPLEYRCIIIRNKFFKRGLIRNIALLMRLKN